MGVTGLWPILMPVKQHRPLSSLQHQTLAVDLSIWVCENQGVRQMQNRVAKPHLRNLFFRVSSLLQLGVNLIFVIEGEAPQVKYQEMSKRLQTRFKGTGQRVPEAKRKYSRSHFKALLRECCELLDAMGVLYIQAKGEAETLCALLNHAGIVDACISDDGDCFLYGATTVYRNLTLDSRDPHVESYSMADMHSQLGLTRERLVALALLLGCDYYPAGVPGVGETWAVKLLASLANVSILERFSQWQKMTRESCIDSVEAFVWQRAVALPDFPPRVVMEEFFSPRENLPTCLPQWRRPDMVKMMVLGEKYLDWPKDYSLDKILPLTTLWDQMDLQRSRPLSTVHLRPLRIMKKRIRQGVPCFEIEWEDDTAGSCAVDENGQKRPLITFEEEGLFGKNFQPLISEWQAAAEVFKLSKRKGTKNRGKKTGTEALTDKMESLTLDDIQPSASQPLPLTQKFFPSQPVLGSDSQRHAKEKLKDEFLYVLSLDTYDFEVPAVTTDHIKKSKTEPDEKCQTLRGMDPHEPGQTVACHEDLCLSSAVGVTNLQNVSSHSCAHQKDDDDEMQYVPLSQRLRERYAKSQMNDHYKSLQRQNSITTDMLGTHKGLAFQASEMANTENKESTASKQNSHTSASAVDESLDFPQEAKLDARKAADKQEQVKQQLKADLFLSLSEEECHLVKKVEPELSGSVIVEKQCVTPQTYSEVRHQSSQKPLRRIKKPCTNDKLQPTQKEHNQAKKSACQEVQKFASDLRPHQCCTSLSTDNDQLLTKIENRMCKTSEESHGSALSQKLKTLLSDWSDDEVFDSTSSFVSDGHFTLYHSIFDSIDCSGVDQFGHSPRITCTSTSDLKQTDSGPECDARTNCSFSETKDQKFGSVSSTRETKTNRVGDELSAECEDVLETVPSSLDHCDEHDTEETFGEIMISSSSSSKFDVDSTFDSFNLVPFTDSTEQSKSTRPFSLNNSVNSDGDSVREMSSTNSLRWSTFVSGLAQENTMASSKEQLTVQSITSSRHCSSSEPSNPLLTQDCDAADPYSALCDDILEDSFASLTGPIHHSLSRAKGLKNTATSCVDYLGQGLEVYSSSKTKIATFSSSNVGRRKDVIFSPTYVAAAECCDSVVPTKRDSCKANECQDHASKHGDGPCSTLSNTGNQTAADYNHITQSRSVGANTQCMGEAESQNGHTTGSRSGEKMCEKRESGIVESFLPLSQRLRLRLKNQNADALNCLTNL